jgi:hypothetical protein
MSRLKRFEPPQDLAQTHAHSFISSSCEFLLSFASFVSLVSFVSFVSLVFLLLSLLALSLWVVFDESLCVVFDDSLCVDFELELSDEDDFELVLLELLLELDELDCESFELDDELDIFESFDILLSFESCCSFDPFPLPHPLPLLSFESCCSFDSFPLPHPLPLLSFDSPPLLCVSVVFDVDFESCSDVVFDPSDTLFELDDDDFSVVFDELELALSFDDDCDDVLLELELELLLFVDLASFDASFEVDVVFELDASLEFC